MFVDRVEAKHVTVDLFTTRNFSFVAECWDFARLVLINVDCTLRQRAVLLVRVAVLAAYRHILPVIFFLSSHPRISRMVHLLKFGTWMCCDGRGCLHSISLHLNQLLTALNDTSSTLTKYPRPGRDSTRGLSFSKTSHSGVGTSHSGVGTL